jgi:hypothetical protein
MTDVVALLKEIRRPAGAGGDATKQQQPPAPAPAQNVSSSCSFAVSDYSA